MVSRKVLIFLHTSLVVFLFCTYQCKKCVARKNPLCCGLPLSVYEYTNQSNDTNHKLQPFTRAFITLMDTGVYVSYHLTYFLINDQDRL